MCRIKFLAWHYIFLAGIKKAPPEIALNGGAWVKFLASTYSPVANATVPSAQKSLASEFGMGSGVSSSL